MGADLYIKNLPREPQYTGYRTDLEAGYFRDSYNATNVLWKYGLSYWSIIKELPMEGEEDDEAVSVEGVKKLLSMVEEAQPVFDDFIKNLTPAWLKENHCNEVDDLAGWRKFWIERSINLKAFLNKAIELNSPMIFSV